MTQEDNPLHPSPIPERSSSGKCRPIVRQDEETIFLSFDSRTKQSEMFRRAPDTLVFSYTRLMMGFLLLQPWPRDILIVGLGGGSLSKYCYRHLPEARITTVEISGKIIALRKTFAIPDDDERFRIVWADGADYIEGCHQDFDAILLDGFDVDGLPARLSTQRFYNRCASALRRDGVLVANLLEGDWGIPTHVKRLSKAFSGYVHGARPDRGFNLIIYASHQNSLPDPDELRHRARTLEKNHEVEFSRIVSKICSDIRPSWAISE